MNFRPYMALILCWLLLGAFLRVQQLPGQWLADDEWHAIHVLQATQGYGALLGYVGVADVSTPLVLYFRLWAEGAGLDEVRMRLPSVLSGLFLLVMAAPAAWRRYGATTACIFTGLLALSPMLIYYSRSSRPYAIALLLAWVALAAAIRWRAAPHALSALTYLSCATIASWMHSSVLPFVGAPLVWIAIEQWRSRSPAAGGTLLLGLLTLVPVAALTLWPMWRNRSVLAERMGGDLPTIETLAGVAHMWTSAAYVPVVAIWLGLAAIGAWQLIRARDEWLLFGAVGLAATLLSVLMLQPSWVHFPLTAARYHLAGLPLLLLCIACGATWLSSRWRFAGMALAALPLLALAGGSTLELVERPNQFSQHSWYQFDVRPSSLIRRELGPIPQSPFWKSLAAYPPKSLTLVVAGHQFESFTVNDVRWQRIHKQRVLAGQRNGLCGNPPYLGEGNRSRGVQLRNAVDLADDGQLRAARADYIVFNLTIWQQYQQETLDLQRCIDSIEKRYGPPVWQDADVVAFKLSGES